jgi:L-aminopeptidase/D-esterase-like protein
MGAPNATITRVPGIRAGHATDLKSVTGCTVVLLPAVGARCIVDVRGGAPGTRETAVLSEGSATPAHAILLGGGSAFGLAAADGVMQWLAERGVGFQTPILPVPIVPAAILFDLATGAPVPPTAKMGYAAADSASSVPVACGSVGAGTGATVGKLFGRDKAMQGGIGSASSAIDIAGGEVVVGALVAVNALGDVWESGTNRIVAGARDGTGWMATRTSPESTMTAPMSGANTTIGVVATDAPVSRTVLTRMAISAHDGLARAIRPAHTAGDGDTIFAVSTAEDQQPLTTRETISLCMAVEDVVARAIVNAVRAAVSRADLPAARDLID